MEAAADGPRIEEQGLVVSLVGREPLGGVWVMAAPQLDTCHRPPPCLSQGSLL